MGGARYRSCKAVLAYYVCLKVNTVRLYLGLNSACSFSSRPTSFFQINIRERIIINKAVLNTMTIASASSQLPRHYNRHKSIHTSLFYLYLHQIVERIFKLYFSLLHGIVFFISIPPTHQLTYIYIHLQLVT